MIVILICTGAISIGLSNILVPYLATYLDIREDKKQLKLANELEVIRQTHEL